MANGNYRNLPKTILGAMQLKTQNRRLDLYERGLATDEKKLDLERKKYETKLPWVERSASGEPEKLPERLTSPEGVEEPMQESASQDLQQMNPELNNEQVALSQVSESEIKAAQIMLENRMKSLGVPNFNQPAEVIGNFTKQMKGRSKLEIKNAVQDNWGELKQPAIEKIEKAMSMAAGNNNIEEVMRLTKLREAWDSGAIINEMFPKVVAYERQLMKMESPAKPKNLEEFIVQSGIDKDDAIELFKHRFAKSKGSGRSRFPDKVKASLELAKFLKKDKPSLNEKIMMALLQKTIPELANVNLDEEEISPENQAVLDQAVDVVADFIGAKKPKKSAKKQYNSPNEIRAAYEAGDLKEKEAVKLLKKFGYE